MVDLVDALSQKKARLQRLQGEIDQLHGEIEVLTKALAILERQGSDKPEKAAAATAPPADIRKQFP